MHPLRREAFPGKREGGAEVNAALPRNSKSGNHLLHAIDSNDNTRWLIDGGALWSIVPPNQQQRSSGPNAWKLHAANGSEIPCYGLCDRQVCIADRVFDFTFIVADVCQPILGADFLSRFYLAPNHRDKCLLDLNDFSEIPVGTESNTQTSRVTNINFVDQKSDPFYQLLDSYPTLSTPSFTPKEVSHGVKHHIPTNCNPIQSKARKLNPEKLDIAKKEFQKLVDLGICYRGKSEWASPLMVATKPCLSPCTCSTKSPCGGWRVCGDYRRLNNATVDDKYPVKSLTDFTTNLHGKKIFSKVDLLKGYHQIPVAEGDVGKTAVITPFGLFIFPRCPFGLKNAGQDFQRMMDAILGDLPFCFVYLDDILVFSNSPEEHKEHLRQIFDILAENGLVVNRAKCVLGVSELDFLGFHVNQEGITPLPEKVAAIRATKAPTSIKELQRFLGMVGYYRRNIRSAALHLDHLFQALVGKPKKLTWTPECEESFQAIKEALAKAAMLRHPRSNATLALTTDASKIAMGGVLEQRGKSGWEPLAFFSARLRPKQREWPPFDRELLAAFTSIRHFRHLLEGRTFTLYTDHQSLIPALSKKSEPHTARQTYQLSNIAEFTTDIRYLKGKANVVADALSRPNGEEEEEEHVFITAINCIKAGNINCICSDLQNSNKTIQPNPIKTADKPVKAEKVEDLNVTINSVTPLGIDFTQMARDQPLDADFRRVSNNPNSGLSFRKIPMGNFHLYVDVSNGPARPFVPFSWRQRIFNAIHGLGHPGIERTRQAIRDKFVWPSLRADVSRWARSCLHCQRAKVGRNTIPPIHEFEVPNKRFSHIHADITMMPESDGYKYLLTMIDRFSRWPAAVPLKDISSETIINAFAHGWISSFGIPQIITTDRGSQFTSSVWSQLLETWGIKHKMTTSYHPEANGMVERFHRRLKESLMALCGDDRQTWFWRLPMALLAIRTTLKPDIDASPADLVYGEGLAVPGDLLPSLPDNANLASQQRATASGLRLEVERLQPKQTSAHRIPDVHIPEDLQDATHVMIRRGGVNPPLTQPYVGPFRVESRTQTGVKVHLPGRGIEEVALARVKPAYSENVDTTDSFDNLEAEVPPSPPPPGRRPGPRTRQPEPTQRVTRQQGGPNLTNPDPLAFDPGEGTSAQAREQSSPIGTDSEDENLHRLRRLRTPARIESDDEPSTPAAPSEIPSDDPFDGHTPADENLAPCQCDPPDNPAAPCNSGPRFFTKEHERKFSKQKGSAESGPKGPSNPPSSRPRTLSFSKPRPGNFSYRKRPDVNALFNLIHDHLNS